MVSATFNPPSLPPIEQVKQFAAAGYFQAIALWVNQPLVPYGIYAQIKPDGRPGCLQVILEFKRPPQKERLVRLLCSRLWQLQSDLIEGVHIIARPIGQTNGVWQRRVRLRRQTAASPSSATVAPSRSPVSPSPTLNRPDARRGQPLHRSARRAVRRSRSAVDRQFKIVRAALLSGSVAAAFIAGCLTEVLISRSPSLPTLPPPSSPPHASPATGTSVAYTPAPARVNSIQAALEPVAVMPHDNVSDPSDPTVTLMFGGEVTVGNVDLSSPQTADQLLQGLPAYAQADVSMVNLGNPLATAGTSIQEGYYRRTRPEAVAALKQGGVDIVGLSGDRTMDLGEQGLIETLDTLDQSGLYRVGAGRNQREARRPEILDVKGQRIAYLSYHAEPAIAAAEDQAGSNLPTREAVLEDVAAIRDGVDWVVVNYRWVDDELGVDPTPQQVDLSRRAIDAGADLVVGYHPQQLQGAEVYKGRAIVYALGDFIFADAPLEDRETAALRVSLNAQQMKVEFLPVTVRRAQPTAATGEQGEAILQQIRQASAQLDQPLNFPAVLTGRAGATVKPVPDLEATPSLGGELEPSDLAPALFDTPPLNRPQLDRSQPDRLQPETPQLERLPLEDNSTENTSEIWPQVPTGSESTDPEAVEWQSPIEYGSEAADNTAENGGGGWSNGVKMPNRFDENRSGVERVDTDGSNVEAFEIEASEPAHHPTGDASPSGGSIQNNFEHYPELNTPQSPARTDSQGTTPFVEDIETPGEGAQEPVLPKLDNWGPKQSPHSEFEPIRNAPSQPLESPRPQALPLDVRSTETTPTPPLPMPPSTHPSGVHLPDAGADALTDTVETEAIGPYSEPLVGPLSFQTEPDTAT